MKNLLFISLFFLTWLASLGQQAKLKEGKPGLTRKIEGTFGIGPVKTNNSAPIRPAPAGLKNGNNTNTVSVLTIGADVTAWDCGYNSYDHKTMLWADDTLKVITYIHGLGPLTPEGIPARLGIDLGINMGTTAADWTLNRQIYAATMYKGNGSYSDEVIMSQAAIYSPPGNTNPENAYCTYFAVNTTNNNAEGGYSYGAENLVTPADSSQTYYWYNPPPYTYLPQGFTITQKGIALMTDISVKHVNGSYTYMDSLILDYGVWNPTLKGFDYTLKTLPLPAVNNAYDICERVAASPDGNTVWIVALADNGGAVQIGPWKRFYPVLFKSSDGGLTWSNPIAVQLDGPNGIEGVKDYLSDNMIHQLFTAPYPTRDQIGYGTAFDCDLNVDKWGNPHVGVVISVPTYDYYVSFTDSSFCVFDIYSTDGGTSWEGVAMGYPPTFRGTFGTVTEDNRVQIASTETGDKMFVTWNATDIPGITTNDSPDVFSRGFDLVTNMITSNGGDQPDNVTYLSDIFQQAYFESTSHYVFTGNNKYTVPIATEMMSDPNNMNAPVTFKYIPDFSYTDADFTIPVPNPSFPVGIDQKKNDLATVTLYPNPAKDLVQLNVNLKQDATVLIQITNLIGQKLISVNRGNLSSGSQLFTLDISLLQPGVYLTTVIVNGQRYSKKMVVE